MTFQRLLFSCAAILFLLVPAWAEDATGKWKASVTGRNGQAQDVSFDLKADGEKLTGSMTSPRGSVDIIEGKVQGDSISFVISFNEMRIAHTGKVSGDELKMTRKLEGAEQSQSFTAKRDK